MKGSDLFWTVFTIPVIGLLLWLDLIEWWFVVAFLALGLIAGSLQRKRERKSAGTSGTPSGDGGAPSTHSGA